MFRDLVVRGPRAEILAGYATAARLRAWTIAKQDGAWTLTSSVDVVFPVLLRGVLRFAAPRKGGFWYWPIASPVTTLADGRITARLGPPQQ